MKPIDRLPQNGNEELTIPLLSEFREAMQAYGVKANFSAFDLSTNTSTVMPVTFAASEFDLNSI